MNHLTTLLREASTDGPPEHVDLDALLGTARSRVRRRRAATGLAVAAVVGLGASVALVGPDGDGSEQEPAAPPQVRVLTLEDAEVAEPGRDYEVLDTFTAHSREPQLTGDVVRGVLPDGRIVAQRYPHRGDGPSRIALVGPGGTRSAEAPPSLTNYLGASGELLVFGNDTDGLWLLDQSSMEWRQGLEGRLLDINVPVQSVDQDLPVGSGPRGGVPNRIYLPASASGQPQRPLFEVDLDALTATEMARGGAVASYAGMVAWTDAHDAPVQEVTVRSGGTTSFDPHTGDCLGKAIGLTADRVVLMSNCDDGAGDSEYSDVVTRIDVFDLDGTPLTRISGDDLGPVRMTDRFLTLASWEDETAGTYTYDLDSGGFLRVTDAMSALAGNETGDGSTLVWEQRLDGDTGATYVVARMR